MKNFLLRPKGPVVNSHARKGVDLEIAGGGAPSAFQIPFNLDHALTGVATYFPPFGRRLIFRK
jgi:hypothetical protein